MRENWERALSSLIAIAAVAIAVVLVHREFFSGGESQASTPTEPAYYSSWKELLGVGRLIGDTAAPVKIIEFGDLECPACRGFNNSVWSSSWSSRRRWWPDTSRLWPTKS